MDERLVQRLADERAVLNQLGRAARLLDSKRWNDVAAIFAEDVQFDYGDGTGLRRGLAPLRETFSRHLDRCGSTQHLLGSVVISVEGDGATTEAYVQARHAGLEALAGDVFDTNGEYIDTWARRDGAWLIVRREVRWFTLSGNPAIIGL